MVDTDPILRLGLMHPCPLVSRKKNLFTTRPQDASHHDTSTIVTYALTHTLTYLRAYLIACLIDCLLNRLLASLECILSERNLLRALDSVA